MSRAAVNHFCPQCGAQLHAGTTCAEHLYRMVMSGGLAPARLREALAQFALSHPMTYSAEALRVASELLAPPEPPAVDRDEVGETTEDAGSVCRWWRHFRGRTSCH